MIEARLRLVRQLISSALKPRETKRIETDSNGAFAVGTLERPGFSDLQEIAREDCSSLTRVYPFVSSTREKLLVCEVLSDSQDPRLCTFWEGVFTERHDCEEFLACAAIGMARLAQSNWVGKCEINCWESGSPRLICHLAIARLVLKDPIAIDHLSCILQRERIRLERGQRGADQSPDSNDSMTQFVLHLLEACFRRSFEDRFAWIGWWKKSRPMHQGRVLNIDAIPEYELAYIPAIAEFLPRDHS